MGVSWWVLVALWLLAGALCVWDFRAGTREFGTAREIELARSRAGTVVILILGPALFLLGALINAWRKIKKRKK